MLLGAWLVRLIVSSIPASATAPRWRQRLRGDQDVSSPSGTFKMRIFEAGRIAKTSVLSIGRWKIPCNPVMTEVEDRFAGLEPDQ
jgi:hypothetical protein